MVGCSRDIIAPQAHLQKTFRPPCPLSLQALKDCSIFCRHVCPVAARSLLSLRLQDRSIGYSVIVCSSFECVHLCSSNSVLIRHFLGGNLDLISIAMWLPGLEILVLSSLLLKSSLTEAARSPNVPKNAVLLSSISTLTLRAGRQTSA